MHASQFPASMIDCHCILLVQGPDQSTIIRAVGYHYKHIQYEVALPTGFQLLPSAFASASLAP